MVSQKIVSSAKIEQELLKIWESLRKENTNKAGLFNLIVYSERTERLGYVRDIVQNLIEKFPSRIIFITYEPNAPEDYLKTAVSVIFPSNSEGAIACDSIDIGVGKNDIEKVPNIILPHLLPDLPIYLFWAENPCNESKLLKDLQHLANRIIYNSESCRNIVSFARFALDCAKNPKADLVDLSWVRTEDWRDLFAAEFYFPAKLKKLRKTEVINISYNSQETSYDMHMKVQALYILFWLSSCLGWKFLKSENEDIYYFSSNENTVKGQIIAQKNKETAPGEILQIQLKTKEEDEFSFLRLNESLENIRIEEKSPKHCELPRNFVIGKFEVGHFLAKEIIMKGTSEHFIKTLKNITDIQK